jgi:Papain-like cysteine protease AvrRpt2
MSTATIPYERQLEPQTNRMCGAACLAMIYRSFGKSVPQTEIWPRISKQNRFGSLASATYLMTQDALSRGLSAMAIQVKYPLQSLKLCEEGGIRAILNHRLKEDVQTGHYSVHISTGPESTVLHDPYSGPSRSVANAALLELWLARQPGAEISGNVLIAIADVASKLPPCKLCGTPIPETVPCRACAKPIPLQPAVLLGCVHEGCSARLWNYLCCPFCDYTWSFDTKAPPRATGAAKAAVDLEPVFAEIDKFLAMVEGLPAAAGNADVRQQVEFIRSGKERMRLAQSEEAVYRGMRQTQLDELGQQTGRNREAFEKRKEQAEKPGSAEDGNELGRALLKNLGLMP